MGIVAVVEGPQGPPGLPGIVWQGVWSSTATYASGDGVQFGNPAVAYLALQASLNAEPDISPLSWSVFPLSGNLTPSAETSMNAAVSESATSATAAATSAANAAGSASAAAGSATSASGSASTATTQAGNASASATAANTSATNAATSATSASGSATSATSSATSAGASATNAASSATAASNSATNAAASATAAAASATSLQGTSTTSLTIGTGSKTLTTQAALQFAVGMEVMIANTAAPANWMYGQVTAYGGTSLTVNVATISGSGTLAAWTISVSGIAGPGPSGTAGGDLTGSYPNPAVSRSGGLGIERVLSATGAPFTASGSATEQSAPAISVPANALIVSGSRLRVTLNVTCIGVGATKTFGLRLGGVLVWTLPAAANQLGGKLFIEIVSTGSAAQKTVFVAAMVGTSGAATVTRTTVDMTQAQTLTPTITPGNTTDSITIEDVLVEIITP